MFGESYKLILLVSQASSLSWLLQVDVASFTRYTNKLNYNCKRDHGDVKQLCMYIRRLYMMIVCSRYLYLTSCFESHIHYIISQRLNNPYRKYGSKISGVKIKRSPPGQGRQVINNIRNILLCAFGINTFQVLASNTSILNSIIYVQVVHIIILIRLILKARSDVSWRHWLVRIIATHTWLRIIWHRRKRKLQNRVEMWKKFMEI